jgi:carboxyl-terminal processing protease
VYRYRDGSEAEGSRKGAPWPRRRALCIVVNEQTLSAAEMVTLALSDSRAAVVVGQPTGGALTLPHYMPMRDGQALSISQALALGPVSRRCPEGRRIQPDRVVPNPSAEDLVAGRDAQLAVARECLLAARSR